jgi:Cu/Ag efflux protein CusF
MKRHGIAAALLVFLLGAWPLQAVADKVIGGTVQDIDRSGLKVILQTDLDVGETQILSVVLPVSSVTMVQGLQRGDYVAVELDKDGKVSRIVKAPGPRG